jgi:hypothetical protein
MSGGTNAVARAIRLRAGFSSRMGMAAVGGGRSYRANTDQFMHAQRVRNTVAALLESLPDNLKDEPSAKLLGSIGDRKVYNMVHLIYRAKKFRGNSKDYEFSRSSMEASSARQLPRRGVDAAPFQCSETACQSRRRRGLRPGAGRSRLGTKRQVAASAKSGNHLSNAKYPRGAGRLGDVAQSQSTSYEW